ncbi:unnamed protein product, partial [Auanema sp. JU1783]
ASNTKYFHYWLTESQTSHPSSDPLLLWLNGGPGCSSVGGLIEELGPFHIADFGNTVYLNPSSWNKFANVLFIESPAGVGYSYATNDDIKTNDDEVAQNNYDALLQFLIKFPEYRGREFYITGESYAGIYLPTLGFKIIQDKTNFPNFKGMAIGNGVLNVHNNYDTMIPLYYYHGVLRDELYNKIKYNCCNGSIEGCDIYGLFHHSTCREPVLEALQGTDDLDPYNLYHACYLSGDQSMKRNFIDRNLRRRFGLPVRKQLSSAAASSVPLCAQTENTATWLNKAEVRKALHIPTSIKKWYDCNDVVNGLFKTTHLDMTMEVEAINAAGVRVLIYNGDVDTVCNLAMNQQFVTALNRTIIGKERVNEPWFYNGETPNVAGMQTKYSGNLDFLTVRGSGHFVPEDKPREALQMIYNFVKQRDYSTAVPTNFN